LSTSNQNQRNKTQSTIAHELGHALGLGHYEIKNKYTDHIMNDLTDPELYYMPFGGDIWGADISWFH
jgi:hypothetical protein